MLREVSRGVRAPGPQGLKPQDDVRPAARQEQESRSPDKGRPEPPEESGRPVGDKASAQRSAREQDEPDAVDVETDETDDEAAARAAAAAQVVQSLTTHIAEEGTEGEEEVPTEGALTLQVSKSSGEADSRQVRTQAATSSSPQVQVSEVSTQPLATSANSGNSHGAFDLLSPQELADVDVQVETEGGEMMERLQQALAANNVEDLDKLGRPVVPQVVRSMATLARNGVSEMRLQLQPGDLGEIELRVRAVEGVIRGEVIHGRITGNWQRE